MNNDGSTTITYERVKADANTIENCRSTMQTIFDDVNNTMNSATDANTTEGRVAVELQGRFRELAGSFQEYTSKIKQLHDLIITTSEATEATETKQAEEASNLANH